MLVLIATLIKMFVCLFVSQFIYHQKSVFQLVHYQCASSQKHTYQFFRLLYFLGATAASGRWLVQEFRSDFTCFPSSQFSRRLTVLFRNSVQRDKPINHFMRFKYLTKLNLCTLTTGTMSGLTKKVSHPFCFVKGGVGSAIIY